MTAPVSPVTCKECGGQVVNKKLGLCMKHYQAWRRSQVKAGKPTNTRKVQQAVQFVIPPDIITNMSKARTTEDWQTLGAAIAPIMSGIMGGTIIASAAQVSLIKDIMNRAYGKPVATQAEKKTSTGVVLLPTLTVGNETIKCPQCEFNALSQLNDDATRQLGIRLLKELLERTLAIYKPTTAVDC